jgi:hypothetical protein
MCVGRYIKNIKTIINLEYSLLHIFLKELRVLIAQPNLCLTKSLRTLIFYSMRPMVSEMTESFSVLPCLLSA